MLPSSSLNNSSPFFLLHKTDPNFNSLRVFGSTCWPLTRPFNHHKFDYRALQCVYFGLSSANRGSICYHIPSKHVYISKDIKFDEAHFPFANISKPKPLSEPKFVSLPLFNSALGRAQQAQSILGPIPTSSSSPNLHLSPRNLVLCNNHIQWSHALKVIPLALVSSLMAPYDGHLHMLIYPLLPKFPKHPLVSLLPRNIQSGEKLCLRS